MALDILVIGLAIEFIITLVLFKNDYLSPAVLFSGAFIVASIDLRMMKKFWNVELRPITTVTILVGVFFFTLASYLTVKTKLKRNRNNNLDIHRKNINIPNYLLIVLIFMYALIIVLSMVAQIRSKGLDYALINLFSSYISAIGGGTELDLPFLLSLFFKVGRMAGYIWCYLLAEQWIRKRLNWRYVILVFEVLLMGFSVGKRSDSVGLLVCLIFDILLLLRQERKIKRVKNKCRKMYFFVFVVITIIPFTFQAIATSMGRDSFLFDPLEYLSIYVGGPILNLDISISKGGFHHPTFLSETFRNLYNAIGKNLHVQSFMYPTDRRFLTSTNGKNIGNVDTTFYDFYHDGGLIAVVVLTIVMACIVSLCYKKTKRNQFRNPLFGTTVTTYIMWLVTRCFFANSFYEWITLSTIETLLTWAVMAQALSRKIDYREIMQEGYYNENRVDTGE